MDGNELESGVYLGDGVYAVYDRSSGMLRLTTGSHRPEHAGNIIYLEPEVLARFDEYLGALKVHVKQLRGQAANTSDSTVEHGPDVIQSDSIILHTAGGSCFTARVADLGGADASSIFVIVVDKSAEEGGKSVTNAAEDVVKYCRSLFGQHRVIYRDTHGQWDELDLTGVGGAIFRPLDQSDPIVLGAKALTE